MKKYDLKSIIVGLIVILLGVSLILIDIFLAKTNSNVWIGVGCSLIASALVILLNVFLLHDKKYNSLTEWGIDKIYSTRAEKNADSDHRLANVKYQVDAIAFGLKSFRTKQTDKVEQCLRKGVNFRIITMDPESDFIEQREKEEKESSGQIKHTVNQLVDWANDLNKKGYKGRILVRGYSCMTLDFYWRLDNEIYVGPYWYGYPSQQTITYKFTGDNKGFNLYKDYFEQLWNDRELVRSLTEITEISVKKNKKKKKK